jgi:cell division protein FtsB
MRWLALFFVALIVALQYPMWLGKGGWLTVREYERQLADQRAHNDKLKARNAALEADVRDLKTGTEAIEERARSDLGMIRQDEVFVQLQPAGTLPPPEAQASARKAAAPRH